jgi:hypothetical protein
MHIEDKADLFVYVVVAIVELMWSFMIRVITVSNSLFATDGAEYVVGFVFSRIFAQHSRTRDEIRQHHVLRVSPRQLMRPGHRGHLLVPH